MKFYSSSLFSAINLFNKYHNNNRIDVLIGLFMLFSLFYSFEVDVCSDFRFFPVSNFTRTGANCVRHWTSSNGGLKWNILLLKSVLNSTKMFVAKEWMFKFKIEWKLVFKYIVKWFNDYYIVYVGLNDLCFHFGRWLDFYSTIYFAPKQTETLDYF